MQAKRAAFVATIFYAGPLALLSMPALADSISAPPITLTASSGVIQGYTGMFDFAAWGYVNFPYLEENYQGAAPTNLSFSWDQAFELPASPAGDYLEVTRVNTYAVSSGNIIIDGQPYNRSDNLDLSPAPFPDPNLYEETAIRGVTVPMDLEGAISIHVYGSFTREYDSNNCCFVDEVGRSVNGTGFEQFLQIERFHADGTPDPFAPEPASFGLVGLALLPVGWMIRRSGVSRSHA